MAELEVAKHGKKVLQLVGAKEHGWGHRLREIAIEFVTIVFAITLSIWLHGWSEHRHKQEAVHVFLAGLKSDLQEDIAQLEKIRQGYRGFDANFRAILALDPGKEPDNEADWKSFETMYEKMDANWFFIPNKSRYEGFLLSGKLSDIEDPRLLNGILALYQSTLPQIVNSENGWRDRRQRMRDYREVTLEDDDRRSHFRLVTSPKGKRMIGQAISHQLLHERYQNYIDQARRIIKMIEKAYPDLAATA